VTLWADLAATHSGQHSGSSLHSTRWCAAPTPVSAVPAAPPSSAKTPELLDDLKRMLTKMPNTRVGLRDRAVLPVGCAGGLRRATNRIRADPKQTLIDSTTLPGRTTLSSW